ncbi:diguanylate cyclase [Desulfonatronospira sp.]|uniref:diguanylate cyclase domain-containing protein n=1 Tax=Desulfonatronospira sp. TaxID=1962951 RepID=UPI0025C349B6|nr:diguanylate cyclase [Desulfonatronospira sp.]
METILLVDSDSESLSDNSAVLRKAGYNVVTASTAQAALETASACRPSLVLLDAELPDTPGLEVCTKIKSMPGLEGISVILLSSARNARDLKVQALETCADGFLFKPLETRELLAHINALLRMKNDESRAGKHGQWDSPVLNSIQESIFCLDKDLNIIWSNQAVTDSLNLDQDQLKGKKCYHFLAGADKPCSNCPANRVQKNQAAEQVVMEAPDGKTWELRIYPFMDGNSHPVKFIEMALDITDTYKSRPALGSSESLLRDMVCSMSGAIVQFKMAPDGSIVPRYISQGTGDLLELDLDEVMSSPDLLWSNMHSEDVVRIHDGVFFSLEKQQSFETDFRVFSLSKTIKWVRITTVPHTHEQKKFCYAFLTEKTMPANELISPSTLHDSLTGLPSREIFLDRLNQACSLAQRYKYKVGMIFFDINDFREINDQFGRSIGDKLLYQTGQRLLGFVRKSDTLARYNGDVFAIIGLNMVSAQGLESMIEKISMSMKDPFLLKGHLIKLGITMGISIFPDDASSAEELIRKSKTRMHRAKDEGLEYLFLPDPGNK